MIRYNTELAPGGGVVLVGEEIAGYDGEFLCSPDSVVDVARKALRMDKKTEEHVFCFCFDVKRRMTGLFEVAHGTLRYCHASPREVFQKAFLANADSIILIHNHPSGESEPSGADIEITEKMVQAGRMMDIPVTDHIIIGHRGWTSLCAARPRMFKGGEE